MDRQPDSPASLRHRVLVPVLVATAAILASTALVARHLGGLARRLEMAESARARQAADVRNDLNGVLNQLSAVRREIDSALEELEETDVLALRLQTAEASLGTIGAAIEAHSSSLLELEEVQAGFVPGLEKELEERDDRLQKRYEALSELVLSAQRVASDSQERLARLDQTLTAAQRPPDLHGMWRELVGPVVQLSGDASVGSGVLLESQPRDEGGYRTIVMTAWHVVRDIQGDPPDLTLPVPVRIYREDGTTRQEEARLLAHEPKLDAALLELITPDPMEFGARLAPRSRLAETRIFDQVVAVGCPLGNDPIPTRGEVATCHHEVDGERYWMINAPTYIGNSGGGIFDSRTHELLGIFSKIYTHGSLRPTIVPHMGLVTPMTRVYDWMERVGYGDIVPKDAPVAKVSAASTTGGE
jgi:hypothetical protein